LARGELLVDQDAASLRTRGFEPLATILHPVRKTEASIIRAEAHALAERDIVALTWNPLGFLVLCLSAELRAHAARLLSQEEVERKLDNLLARNLFLDETTRAKISRPRLTQVLRGLLAEQVSIRDMRRVLEAILSCDYVAADETELIVFDERIGRREVPSSGTTPSCADLMTCARRALKSYLSHKYTAGQSALTACPLDHELERQLIQGANGAAPLSESEIDQIIGAIRVVLAKKAPSESLTILTGSEARRPFRQVIEKVFPDLPVVAYQELSPSINITPIGKISLSN
jgi:type III secretion protein V